MEKSNLFRIKIENLSKTFNSIMVRPAGALAGVLSVFSNGQKKKELKVLKNISFQASAGENIGIIGRNGSGKSTLLRVMAGIYQSNQGKIEVNGELVYLSGFGFGLKERLTMRENIKLVGLLMGLSSKEIDKRFDDIVEFSEQENFVDTKIYQFSSGMLSRLRFSITIHCLQEKKADIILLDEVFGSGGDMAFDNKAVLKMEEFIRGGATVIMVSHNLKLIEKYCHRVVLLEKGSVVKEGSPETVISFYNDIINNDVKNNL